MSQFLLDALSKVNEGCFFGVMKLLGMDIIFCAIPPLDHCLVCQMCLDWTFNVASRTYLDAELTHDRQKLRCKTPLNVWQRDLDSTVVERLQARESKLNEEVN
jgi:hypothetical protein